ncbi:MAG: acyltransferase [Chitinophagaceae bacterium]|nr:MAG: acyltransferase [Chitinophagaceae bacterium]
MKAHQPEGNKQSSLEPLKLFKKEGLVCSRTSAAIDLLRGVFAILVVLAHATEFYKFGVEEENSLRGFGFHIFSHAGFWVSGFFVISGFCIQLSIQNLLQKGRLNWSHYLLARFTRIYPMAFIGLLAAVLVWWQFPYKGQPFPWSSFLGTLAMTQNLTGLFPYYGQSWSLTNEVIYYLAWPIFLCLQRFNTVRALIAATVCALTTAAVMVIIWKVWAGGRADHWLVPVWSILASSILWLAGAGLLYIWPVIAPRVNLKKCAWLLPLSSVACLVFYFASYLNQRAWVLHLATYCAIPFFALLILSGRNVSYLDSPRARRLCKFLGIISYPVYILHLQVLFLVKNWRWQMEITLNWPKPVSYLLLVVVVLGFCCAVGGLLELATLRWRARLLARGRVSRVFLPAVACQEHPSPSLSEK